MFFSNYHGSTYPDSTLLIIAAVLWVLSVLLNWVAYKNDEAGTPNFFFQVVVFAFALFWVGDVALGIYRQFDAIRAWTVAVPHDANQWIMVSVTYILPLFFAAWMLLMVLMAKELAFMDDDEA